MSGLSGWVLTSHLSFSVAGPPDRFDERLDGRRLFRHYSPSPSHLKAGDSGQPGRIQKQQEATLVVIVTALA
jgi:hypothetical protein